MNPCRLVLLLTLAVVLALIGLQIALAQGPEPVPPQYMYHDIWITYNGGQSTG